MARILLERAKAEFDSTERIQYDPRLAAVDKSIKTSGESNSIKFERDRTSKNDKANEGSNNAKLVLDPANKTAIVQDLHERMGHAAENIMCRAIDHDPPLWKNKGLTSKEIRRTFRKRPCVWCALCKRNDEPPITTREKKVRFKDQQPDTHKEEEHTYTRGECVSADDNGPVSPAGMLGELYWLLFKDVVTGQAQQDTDNIWDILSRVQQYHEIFPKQEQDDKDIEDRFRKTIHISRGRKRIKQTGNSQSEFSPI
jgi:hypothetical protein